MQRGKNIMQRGKQLYKEVFFFFSFCAKRSNTFYQTSLLDKPARLTIRVLLFLFLIVKSEVKANRETVPLSNHFLQKITFLSLTGSWLSSARRLNEPPPLRPKHSIAFLPQRRCALTVWHSLTVSQCHTETLCSHCTIILLSIIYMSEYSANLMVVIFKEYLVSLYRVCTIRCIAIQWIVHTLYLIRYTYRPPSQKTPLC